MTPQEKLDWFWAIGQVPGTLFDDINDGRAAADEQPFQRRARFLSSARPSERTIEAQKGASIGTPS